MPKTPKISIILPFHNAEKWIEKTINSIIHQELIDFEVIAINDYSTDNSLPLLKKIASNDRRIRVFENNSKGIIPALQLGLEKSKGEFITRMDADDIMPFNRLKLFLEKIENKEKTIVTGKVNYFSDGDISEGYIKYQNWLNKRVDQNDYFNHIYRECVIASPNWMARKIDLIQFNIFENLTYPEDYSMTFLWKENGFSVEGIKDTTLLWREHPERTSRNSIVYEQKSFFKLKLPWFKKTELNPEKSIALIGIGDKGKLVGNYLESHNIAFNTYDLNFKNYNSGYFGKEVKHPKNVKEDLLIICVYPENPQEVELFFSKKGYQLGENMWFF